MSFTNPCLVLPSECRERDRRKEKRQREVRQSATKRRALVRLLQSVLRYFRMLCIMPSLKSFPKRYSKSLQQSPPCHVWVWISIVRWDNLPTCLPFPFSSISLSSAEWNTLYPCTCILALQNWCRQNLAFICPHSATSILPAVAAGHCCY